MKQVELFHPDEINGPQGQEALEKIKETYQNCERCRLHERRIHIVFGQGAADHPDIAFVGEGPGQMEDQSGEPFCGRSGVLLNKMIKAMGTTREHVFVSNIVACRPPENRTPFPDEIQACSGLASRQLLAVSPKILVALGTTAAQTLLKDRKPLSRLRNKWHEWNGIPLRATYHPAALLRNPDWKAQAWNDLQEVMKKIRELQF